MDVNTYEKSVLSHAVHDLLPKKPQMYEGYIIKFLITFKF